MPPDILTPPAVEPVDLAYAKTFLRVDGDAEDALISDMIVSARHSVETLCGQAMISRRVSQSYAPNFRAPLMLKAMPAAQVHAVYAVDAAGNRTLIEAQNYRVNTRCTPPVIDPLGAVQLPFGAAHIEIEYTAGFGAQPSDVPMPLRQALLLLLAQSYEHRGAEANMPVPMMVDALLMPYRWMRL